MRGDVEGAKEFNPYSLRLFLFFLAQFFMRIGLVAADRTSNFLPSVIWYLDIGISILLFIWSFYPFIRGVVEVTCVMSC